MFLLKESDKEREMILSDIPEIHPGMGIWEFGRKCLGHLKPWMFATLICVALAEICNLAGSYVIKHIIDTLSVSSTDILSSVLLFVGIFIGITFFQYIILWRMAGFFASHYTNATYLRTEYILFSYISKHNPGFYFNHFAGGLASKIRNVALGYWELFEGTGFTLMPAIISIIGTSLVFTQIHWQLAIIMIIWIIGNTTVYVIMGKQKRIYSRKKAEKTSIKTGKLVDAMSNMLTITLFSRQKAEGTEFSKALYNETDSFRAAWRYTEIIHLIVNAFSLIAISALLLVTIWLWHNHLATAGDFILVLTLSQRINFAIKDMGNLLNKLNQSLGSIAEGLDDLLIAHGVPDLPDAEDIVVSTGNINFEDVAFAYEGRTNVLEHFNLSITPGEKIGVVGRSGVGKTTLISLLLRFYDSNSGKILIDNQDISYVTQKSLRENIGVVPQEPLLFHRSILENIRYGAEKATDEDVHNAAKLAQADGFISNLPEGYNTKVGERGVKLSGGQRQRVAIARAILKNAPILVLDEATASLDSESEIAISNALHNLVKDKTVIAIAHRLSTLREMTRIIVMDEGKIIESGTHEILLKKGGLYADLWKAQAGGFLT